MTKALVRACAPPTPRPAGDWQDLDLSSCSRAPRHLDVRRGISASPQRNNSVRHSVNWAAGSCICRRPYFGRVVLVNISRRFRPLRAKNFRGTHALVRARARTHARTHARTPASHPRYLAHRRRRATELRDIESGSGSWQYIITRTRRYALHLVIDSANDLIQPVTSQQGNICTRPDAPPARSASANLRLLGRPFLAPPINRSQIRPCK
jgi:hypothetical protein